MFAATALRQLAGRFMPNPQSHVPLSLVLGANPRTTSDGDLARAMAAGAPWAISEAWRRFAPMVLNLAERSLGSRHEAEDLGQDVFCSVFRKVKTLREPERLRSFVYSFAVREVKSHLRRRKLRSWLSFQQPETLVEMSQRSLDMESRDLLRRCYTLLDALRPRDRLVFVLRRMESMTVDEIATTMDISVSTVKRSMSHAEARLSRWIDSDPGLAELLSSRRWKR
jgi:RNA polymerase sigma-70 factor, ECF subfamily